MGRKVNKISIDDLAGALISELNQYSDKVNADVKKAVRKTADVVKAELLETSPKDTGDYAHGWKASITKDENHAMHITIHNEKYQIVHLLENGHVLRRGGRTIGDGSVSAKPHVKQAEEHGNQMLEELITEALS